MKQIRKRLTYANVMSSIAVFLVLGGATAFAASKITAKQLQSNSVTTAKIKKNAVTASKIKNNAITTSKVANGAITGAKVNLGSLGTVPSATNAVNAVNATNAVNFSRYSTSGIVRASVGQNINILTIGPFSVIGKCRDLGGNEFAATTFLTTSQPGSSMSGYENNYETGNFAPGVEAELNYEVSSTTPEITESYGGYYSGFNGVSGDGKTLVSGEVNAGVHIYGGDCVFWAHATNDS